MSALPWWKSSLTATGWWSRACLSGKTTIHRAFLHVGCPTGQADCQAGQLVQVLGCQRDSVIPDRAAMEEKQSDSNRQVGKDVLERNNNLLSDSLTVGHPTGHADRVTG